MGSACGLLRRSALRCRLRRRGSATARPNGDLEGLQRGKAFRFTRLATRDGTDETAVYETGRIAAFVALRRGALQTHFQTKQRQRHAAAATELAPLDPGRQPATAEHSLILDVLGPDVILRGEAETLDPQSAATRAG